MPKAKGQAPALTTVQILTKEQSLKKTLTPKQVKLPAQVWILKQVHPQIQQRPLDSKRQERCSDKEEYLKENPEKLSNAN